MTALLIFVQWAARLIMILLVALSVWSVAIMLDRYRLFKSLAAQRDLEKWKAWIKTVPRGAIDSRGDDPVAGTLRTAVETPTNNPEAVERAVKSFLLEEKTRLEKGLTVLATLGANAPFIGLFGTVLGIIQAFGELARNQSGMQNVMGAISEALVSTAIGLFVAIPAVVAYNVFSKQVKGILTDCEVLRDLYLSRVGR